MRRKGNAVGSKCIQEAMLHPRWRNGGQVEAGIPEETVTIELIGGPADGHTTTGILSERNFKISMEHGQKAVYEFDGRHPSQDDRKIFYYKYKGRE